MHSNIKKLGTNLGINTVALGVAVLIVLPTIVTLRCIQPQTALSTVSKDVERDASYRGSGR